MNRQPFSSVKIAAVLLSLALVGVVRADGQSAATRRRCRAPRRWSGRMRICGPRSWHIQPPRSSQIFEVQQVFNQLRGSSVSVVAVSHQPVGIGNRYYR